MVQAVQKNLMIQKVLVALSVQQDQVVQSVHWVPLVQQVLAVQQAQEVQLDLRFLYRQVSLFVLQVPKLQVGQVVLTVH